MTALRDIEVSDLVSNFKHNMKNRLKFKGNKRRDRRRLRVGCNLSTSSKSSDTF